MLGVGIRGSVEPQQEVMGWVSLGHVMPVPSVLC